MTWMVNWSVTDSHIVTWKVDSIHNSCPLLPILCLYSIEKKVMMVFLYIIVIICLLEVGQED